MKHLRQAKVNVLITSAVLIHFFKRYAYNKDFTAIFFTLTMVETQYFSDQMYESSTIGLESCLAMRTECLN